MSRASAVDGTEIRSAVLTDLDAFVTYLARHFEESGTGGDPIYSTYERDDPLDVALARERTRERWTTRLEEIGWRRAFAAFDGERVVGHAELAGAPLRAGRHRVELGLGVLRSHRRRGLGAGLLAAALDWVRAEASIDWVDLGMFAPNDAALALYRKFGFQELGRTPDRYRVSGVRLEEILMTLDVSSAEE